LGSGEEAREQGARENNFPLGPLLPAPLPF